MQQLAEAKAEVGILQEKLSVEIGRNPDSKGNNNDDYSLSRLYVLCIKYNYVSKQRH